MLIADDYEYLHHRVNELEEQDEIGYGAEPLAQAIRDLLAICQEVELVGTRTLSTGRIRGVLREGLS